MARNAMAVAVLVVALLAATAPARAAVQQNVYSASGDVSPAQSGTPVSPVSVGVVLDGTFGEASGLQPAALRRQTWSLYGVRADVGDHFPACTPDQINTAGYSDRACPSGSLIGSGTLTAFIYPDSDPSGTRGGFSCDRSVRIYNAGLHATTMFVFGDPDRCGGVGALPVFPSSFVPGEGAGTAWQFDIPALVSHPIQGLSWVIRSLHIAFDQQTTSVDGVTRGYFESVGCQGTARPLTASFTTESGAMGTAGSSLPCPDGGSTPEQVLPPVPSTPPNLPVCPAARYAPGPAGTSCPNPCAGRQAGAVVVSSGGTHSSAASSRSAICAPKCPTAPRRAVTVSVTCQAEPALPISQTSASPAVQVRAAGEIGLRSLRSRGVRVTMRCATRCTVRLRLSHAARTLATRSVTASGTITRTLRPHGALHHGERLTLQVRTSGATITRRIRVR